MLTDAEAAEKATAIFKWYMEYYPSIGLKGGYITRRYAVNEVEFYIDPMQLDGGMDMTICHPGKFNPYDVAHMEALHIAKHIYGFMTIYESVLWVVEHGFSDGFDSTSKDIAEAVSMAQAALQLPIYPCLPGHVQERLYDALDTFMIQHEQALELEAEMCLAATRASARHGYIYLLQSTVGYWKIGRSGVPVQRIGKLEVVLPFPIDVEALIETADMYYLEGSLHKKYEAKRVRGEWFALTPDDIAHIKSLAVQS